MHIFSNKTVQLFVRSLRGFIKSFSVIFPKLTANTNSCFHSANHSFAKCKYMVWPC